MRKIICLLLCVILSVPLFAACGDGDIKKNQKLSVVTTVFPEYDWVTNILGEKSADTDITLLLDNGVDLHSFQPTAKDIVKISNCDIFVYVGGESDKWVSNALKEATNENMIVINLLEVLGSSVKEEELKEGMQSEETEETAKKEEKEYDEHVWLSLKNAVRFCDAICDALKKADEENADIYSQNAESYKEKLKSLDSKYLDTLESATLKTLLFADRFPFRYLTDDYGLDYYAAFLGCSAESEADFETVTFLANKVDELKLSSVIALDGSDRKIAKAVVSAAKKKDVNILSLNSMQSVTGKDLQSGESYLSIMEKNLDVIETALR